MKKFLRLGLLLLAAAFVPVVTSCGDKGNDPIFIPPVTPPPQKVIEEQYRGTFIRSDNKYTLIFGQDFYIQRSDSKDIRWPAWTVGAELHRDDTKYGDNPDELVGTFEDKDTFKNRTETFTRINN